MLRILMLTLALLTVVASPVAAQNKGLQWGGLAVSSGGAVLSLLGNTALRTESCAYVETRFTFGYACVEESNRALVWTGIAMSAGGAAMYLVGSNKRIRIGPRRVQFIWQF